MGTRKPEVTELEVNRECNPVRLLLRKDWQHLPQCQAHSDSQEVRLAVLTDSKGPCVVFTAGPFLSLYRHDIAM